MFSFEILRSMAYTEKINSMSWCTMCSLVTYTVQLNPSLHVYFISDEIVLKCVKTHDTRIPMGVQWLSGRVLDSRPRGHGLEPQRRHCVVSLSKNINPSLELVRPRKTSPIITERLLMGRKESKQTNKQPRLLKSETDILKPEVNTNYIFLAI